MMLALVAGSLTAGTPAATTAPGRLPTVPPGFEITVFAGEPLIYKPTSLCFDEQGRLLVGQGPQYHLSKAVDEPDSVVMLLDTNGDGVADERKIFATGFNSIQGLAWKGGDLYVANSPELTVVRDRDGDGVADEYVVVFTDLGNHEHALHGLNWGPDGRLYMSKGNSKGHNQPAERGRVAPKAFRELWDVAHPPDAPDIPEPRVYPAATYRRTLHDPADDWGREGGVLRCDPLGRNLEIVARGMRNPWDIALDAEFNWLGTDNDQTQGDRIIMPFMGAHFGWGHRYSSHWTGLGNLPTVPVSGPVTSGSWVGIVYYAHPHFPAEYRDVFFINDWMYGTFVYRPGWDGALRQSAGGVLEPLIRRSEGGMLYRPTDLDFGPDGSLYSLGWGGNYHYEPGQEGGWVFRLRYVGGDGSGTALNGPAPKRPVSDLGVDELIAELGPEIVPARRVNAQDELVRRGSAVRAALIERLQAATLDVGRQTWAIWALGRMEDNTGELTAFFRRLADPAERYPVNLRIQSLRILGDRAGRFGARSALTESAAAALRDSSSRIRFEGMQAIRQARAASLAGAVVATLKNEPDRLVYYSGWQALRDLAPVEQRRQWLEDASPRVRLAALLGLQEDYAVTLAGSAGAGGSGVRPRGAELGADVCAESGAAGENAERHHPHGA
jgi:quinoprotein glucose dehydrogenase